MQVGLAIFIACFIWCAANFRGLDEYFASVKERNQFRHEVAELESQIAEAEREIGLLERRGFADEATARERFKLVKPGEKVVFVEYDEE